MASIALWKIPKNQTSKLPRNVAKARKLDLEIQSRKTIIQILVSLILVVGLFFTWQQIFHIEDQIMSNQQFQQRQFKENQNSREMELFTKAVDQLSSDQLSVRLGGIYVLEHIAEDSKKDHDQVMEVLVTYIKSRFPSEKKKNEFINNKNVPADMQAIMGVFKIRKWTNKENKSLDLSKTNLQKVDLTGANLSNINLAGADLRGSILNGANLKRVNLEKANLHGAEIFGANLEEAVLKNANLEDAQAREANLRAATLRNAWLANTNFIEANLIDTDLEDAMLRGADFRRASLYGANLNQADLREANLKGSVLSFERSSVKNLTNIQLSETSIDKTTKLPDYLK